MDAGTPRRFVLSDWLVERDLNRLTRGAERQQLEPKAIEVLCRLAADPGEVVSREALLAAAWPGRAVVDQVLTRAIGQLRVVLGDDAQRPRFIETVARRGYRLLVGVEAAAPAGAVLRRPKRARGPGPGGIATLALLGLSLAGVALHAPASPPLRTVAVRPFKTLSGTPVPRDYADGLAESVVTALARAPGLKVIASGTDAAGLPLEELGRRLDVDAVIEGSVQQEGGALRATVRLVRVPDGQVVWGGSARSPGTGEWFAVQDQVVAQVLAAVARSGAARSGGVGRQRPI